MKSKSIFIFIVVCIITIIIDWLKFEISELTHDFFINFAILLNIIIFISLIIWSIIYIIKNINEIKWKAFLPCIIIVFTIALNMYIPLTDSYVKLNFLMNLNNREKIVQMYENNQLNDYQTGMDKYMLPLEYRLSSHTGRIFTQNKDNGTTKILFFVHCGFNSSVIIYVSNGSGIDNGDFDLKYHDIRLLKKNWYSAILLKNDN